MACSAPRDSEEARRLLASRRAELVADEARLRTALREEAATPTTSECVIAPHARRGETIAITIWRASDLSAQTISVRRSMFESDAAEIVRRFDDPSSHVSADGARRWSERVTSAPGRYEIAVAVTRWTDPRFVGATSLDTARSFAAGVAAGRAVMFDHHDHRILCARDVEAQSSETLAPGVRTAENLGRTLSRDLETNLGAAARAALSRER